MAGATFGITFCWHVLLLAVFSTESHGTEVNFEPRSYYFRRSYEEVQNNITIFNATFNVASADASITSVEIPDTTYHFEFRSDFGVQNIRPLPARQYSFQIAAYTDLTAILASVVVDVISQSGRACIEQSFGRCHHFCRENQVQTINYECYCEKGYILQGNFDCLAVGGNPEIFISNLTEIARVMVLGSTYSSLLHLDNITAFDYNYEKAILYVVTAAENHYSIVEFLLQNLSMRVLKELHGVSITFIALNWLNNEIYFIDEQASSILSFNVTDLSVTVVLTGLDVPRHLIYSNLRNLIWISGSQENTLIECYSLDERITTNSYNLSNIIDISISTWNDQLFILTEMGLFSVALMSNGSAQRVTSFGDKMPIAVDVFEVYSYVLLEDGFIIQVNNRRPSEKSIIPALPGSLDIAIYHQLKQVRPPGNIDCSQCEGECLVMDSVTRCVCGKEFILGVDGRSCQRSEASTFLTSYNYHGGTIVELDLFGPWKQKLLIGMSQAGVTAGQIYGMDIDLEDGVIYYGDNELRSIWQVSLKPQLSNVDNRKKVLDNTTVSDMAYDWINRQLYWIGDESKSICRTDVSNFNSKMLFYEGEHQILGIAVNPFNGLLYWSDSTGIKKKVVNEVTSPVETVWNACCTQALAIDILSNNLYWFENINNNISYMKLSLTANSSQMLLNLPTDDFAPFRLTVLRNYLIVTSDTKTKFAIIDIDDSTVTFRETIRNTPYLAVAVASPIRQPSQSLFSCLTSGENCSYVCVTENSDPSKCLCPVGYYLSKDNVTCSGCPPNTFGPDCAACTTTCVHGACSQLDGSCICNAGYTGSPCDTPICDQVFCGSNGECSAPNVCQCDDTYTGQDCTRRKCTAAYCSFSGNCTVLDGGFNLDCTCISGRTGPQCQIPDLFPSSLQGIQIGVPVGVIVPFLLAIVFLGFLVFGYIKIKRSRKSAAIWNSNSRGGNDVVIMNEVEKKGPLDDISGNV